MASEKLVGPSAIPAVPVVVHSTPREPPQRTPREAQGKDEPWQMIVNMVVKHGKKMVMLVIWYNYDCSI